MIDKLSNINAGTAQNKRATEHNKVEGTDIKVSKNQLNTDKKEGDVKISSELSVKEMSSEAPFDVSKVSAIKEAIAKGDYPVDLDKVADALLQAYQDIK